MFQTVLFCFSEFDLLLFVLLGVILNFQLVKSSDSYFYLINHSSDYGIILCVLSLFCLFMSITCPIEVCVDYFVDVAISFFQAFHDFSQ